MKRFITLYILSVLILSIQAQQIPTRYTIVFIGNSITYGATLQSPETESPPVEAIRILKGKGYDVRYVKCGYSGSTTVDFLPASNDLFPKVVQAVNNLYEAGSQLIFSIMIGTNDSAMEGPKGSPVSPADYRKNLQTIIDSLYTKYPGSHFILHRPIWYSPNTHNRSLYLEEGLQRLQTYTPELNILVKDNPEYVFKGDWKAYDFFKKNFRKYFTAEEGNSGVFFLHPNKEGAKILGKFWADNLKRHIDNK